MKYEVIDEKYTRSYIESYRQAIHEGNEKKCLLGQETQYRMIVKDSVLLGLTDPVILLEYCIYPLFHSGDKQIGCRTQKSLREMADSEDIICIYQVIRFIYAQDRLVKRYDDLPLLVNVKEIVPILIKKVDKLSSQMKTFKEGEFALFPRSIYEMTQAMMKKSSSFL